MQNKLGIVFQGTVRTDARVLREIQSFSKLFDQVIVYASHVNEDDIDLLPNIVSLIPFSLQSSWINRNVLFGNQFLQLQKQLLADRLDYLICIDYPTLKLGVKLKEKQPSLKLIYDSHEIYVETINQFFPRKGWKKVYGIPLILLNQWLHSRAEKRMVQQVDHCITVCSSLSTYFQDKWNKKSAVLRNCPSLEHIPTIHSTQLSRQKVGLNEADHILVYQGDVNPGRGLFTLLSVMQQLPSTFHLLLLGDGMLLQELKDYVTKNEIKNVTFLGRISYSELLIYSRLADVGVNFIEPINDSKRYSLPNKLFEYMAVGLPIVSNDLPEPRALFEEYHCGVTVNLNNIKSVKDTIISMFEDITKMAQMSKNGVEAIQQRLNWEKEFNLYLKDHLHFYKVKASAIAD